MAGRSIYVVASLAIIGLTGCGGGGQATTDATGATHPVAHPRLTPAALQVQGRAVERCLRSHGFSNVSFRRLPANPGAVFQSASVQVQAQIPGEDYGDTAIITATRHAARQYLGLRLGGAGGSYYGGIYKGAVAFAWFRGDSANNAEREARPRIEACAFSIPAAYGPREDAPQF
jgi:hypothetical protein